MLQQTIHGHKGLVIGVMLAISLLALTCSPSQAEGPDAPEVVSAIQSSFSRAKIEFSTGDKVGAEAALAKASVVYDSQFVPLVGNQSSEAVAAGAAALRDAADAVERGDQPGFAAAGGTLQAALYRVGHEQTLSALRRGNVDSASEWHLLRTYRPVSRFERVRGDPTRALSDLRAGVIGADDAAKIVGSDLLDTYQSRLTVALHNLKESDSRRLAASRAEQAALAEGYFAILSGPFAEQRGDSALATTRRDFAALLDAARAGQSVGQSLPRIEEDLRGFRAAPLTVEEQSRRAGQLLRFVDLIAVEYARGVRGNQVTIPLEIQEAATLRDGASAAFEDLRVNLEGRDSSKTRRVSDAFDNLEQQLQSAKTESQVASAEEIRASADRIATLLAEIMPAEWQRHDTGADFDVIGAALDQMEQAVDLGQYDLAESARLEAYAILESGPEAKLVVFAPQMKQPIEDLFWFGQGKHRGLAALIAQGAPKSEISASRAALNAELAAAEKALAGNNAPLAVASNAVVIVFREGLEAVLILASLMGSLKAGPQRSLRRPLWIGTVIALIATALTWILARAVIVTLASYGERLEAVVSLVAVAVLLLITNWFFHDVYWTSWMAGFHRHKKQIIGSVAGQFVGLVVLGFTSVYREGFETVLFLQALVLESGAATVMSGVGVGLAATALIGLLVFVVQARLPHKKMLVFTGILIGAVLLQMIGNTVHVLQVVGWLPIHPIGGSTSILPYWVGLWLGIYATWEGILLQASAGAFTIGSYLLAEYLHKREVDAAIARQAMSSP